MWTPRTKDIIEMRYKSYLRQRYRLLIGYVGGISAVIGLLILFPLVILLFYPEEANYAVGLLIPGVPLAAIGALIWYRLRPPDVPQITFQEGTVIVLFSWMIAIFIGSIPLMLISDLTFPQAVFESTSGWTTTGLSVVNVEEAPKLILFYRSFIQFAGGAGFAIIALSAIAGSFSAGLVGAEGRVDQLAPHVRHSANIVLTIYSSYAVVGTIALKIAGMDWFDAINHAFAALSTGGFSTRAASIGYWDNPVIEGVILVLMLLGTINFVIAYTFLRGKFRVGLRSGEIRLLGVALLIGTGLLLIGFTSSLYPSIEKGLRVAIFETASAITTTGFSTVDYRPWPPVGWLVLIVLMVIGGGTGSTAGGIKQLRIYIIYKAIIWEIRKAFLPRHTLNEPAIWQGEDRSLLTDQQIRHTVVFVGFYLFLFLMGSGSMMLYGYSMQESLFEFASTLGTVGLSVGVTHPDMPIPLMWMQSLGMVLGRLEIFTVIIGLLKIGIDSRIMVFGTR